LSFQVLRSRRYRVIDDQIGASRAAVHKNQSDEQSANEIEVFFSHCRPLGMVVE
jgi:hypothetical protein